MGIESVSSQTTTQVDMSSVMMASDAEVQEIATEIAPLFSSESNLSVQSTSRKESETVRETEDVPVLDEAELEKFNGNNVDLEALIAKLQAETDKAQLDASMERIDSLKGQMSASHENTMAKVNESIEAMKEQEQSQKLQEALGWLGVIVAIGMAVLTCVTGGSAAAIAVAVIGAVLTTAMQILNETGVMEDLTDWMADCIQDMSDKLSEEGRAVSATGGNKSREECEAEAQLKVAIAEIMIMATVMVVGLVCGGSKLGGKAAVALAIASAVMMAASIGSQAWSVDANYDASMAQADLTEDSAILKRLQTMLDQETDALQELLQQLSDSMGAVFELLDSKQQTLNTINMNICA